MGAKKYPLKCWETLKPTKSRGGSRCLYGAKAEIK
nr:MAG TPA: hypothetical protein [Bacteriophage sp.]